MILKERILIKSLIKNFSSMSLILLSFSGIIMAGVMGGSRNFRYRDTQLETFEWVSENIPIHSGILTIDNFFIGVGVDSITFVSTKWKNISMAKHRDGNNIHSNWRG